MLVGEIDRLERATADLEEYRVRFHEADKKVGVLEERSKRGLAGEILFGAGLAAGSAAVSYAASLPDDQATAAPVLYAVGLIVLLAGVGSRIALWKK